MPKRRANGEGSIYQRKDGKWCAQYIDCLGKKRYLYGKTQQAVRKKLQEAIRQNDAGISLEPKRITFSAWVKEWLDVYQKPTIRESTYSYNLKRWTVHIEPYFNRIQLKDIRAEHIQKFVNEKAEKRLDGKPGGYSAEMVRLLYLAIRGSLEKAVELGYIPKNPANSVNLKAMEHTDKRIFSVEEQRRFEKRVREDIEQYHNSSIFLLLLYTGMRIGEALGLQISDIDFKTREIHINRTAGTIDNESGQGKRFYVSSPKTKAGKRIIPMSDTAADLLAGQIEYRNRLVDGMRPVWLERGIETRYADEGYIYVTDCGNVLNYANLKRKLNQICEKADIHPRITPHGLRHTFATRWIEAGLDVRSLAEILGHTDIKMTLNIYTHALPEQKRKNMNAIDKWMNSE